MATAEHLPDVAVFEETSSVERVCPVCRADDRELLHKLPLTYGADQSIYACKRCGMVYASVDKPFDYDADSIYALPDAIGSGETASDRGKHDERAELFESLGIAKDAKILDLGSAKGGLLDALRERG